ncbi:MAG: hypothetical protein O2854_08830 [Chloroflexi bacterium]|nr:hypothetical protein [Chloroflexota bacterium]
MNGDLVLLSILVAVTVLAGCNQREAPVEPLAFDKATWLATDSHRSMANPRHQMSLALVQQGTLIGKSEDDVRLILGDPMYALENWPTNGARQLQYRIGPSTSLTGLSFEALFVDLSAPSGVVVKAMTGQRNF